MSFFNRLFNPDKFRENRNLDDREEDDRWSRVLLIIASAVVSALPVYSIYRKSRLAMDGQTALQKVVYLSPIVILMLILYAFYRAGKKRQNNRDDDK